MFGSTTGNLTGDLPNGFANVYLADRSGGTQGVVLEEERATLPARHCAVTLHANSLGTPSRGRDVFVLVFHQSTILKRIVHRVCDESHICVFAHPWLG